jgi:hypothetical protein
VMKRAVESCDANSRARIRTRCFCRLSSINRRSLDGAKRAD